MDSSDMSDNSDSIIQVDVTDWSELDSSESFGSDYSPAPSTDESEEWRPGRITLPTSSRKKKKKLTKEKPEKRRTQRMIQEITPHYWGESDLGEFLRSLKEHCPGLLDPEEGFPRDLSLKIQHDLPHRGLFEIEEAGRRFCGEASESKAADDTTLDVWHDLADGMSSSEIDLGDIYASALSIGKQEPLTKQPVTSKDPNDHPGDPNDPDFGQLYEYLAAVFRGEEEKLPELYGVEALVMSDCIERMFNGQSCAELHVSKKKNKKKGVDVKEHLSKMLKLMSQPEDAEKVNADDDRIFMELLNNASLFNPFGIRKNVKFSKHKFRAASPSKNS